MLSHRLFLLPAFGPLIYNVFIIAGGVIAGRQMGIASLAYGALAGSIAGPFLINAIGAAKIGTGYQPSFDLKNPAFREWVQPFDPADAGRFAGHGRRLDPPLLRFQRNRRHCAPQLCQAPLRRSHRDSWTGRRGRRRCHFSRGSSAKRKFDEFAATVNASVYRITAASLLATGWMMAIALPLIDLVYRRGHFTFRDSASTAVYFFWFSLSLALWSSQALYARAFYASGNTLTPMIATSLITLASLPHLLTPVSDALCHRTGHRVRHWHCRQCHGHRSAAAYSRHGAAWRTELERTRQVPRWWEWFPAD